MNKTPVSILQEMMVKKQTVPNYELIHDGGGTHINTFTYQVTCDGLSATGTGRSKKDAKHEAAQAMLEAIAAHRGYPQLPASPAQSPLKTPLPPTVPEPQRIPPNMPFVNAIGALQDLCAENILQGPKYTQISDVGPPHAKIFTIQCTVADFNEVGVARTKKQAKHEAAKKMLHKITDLVADLKDRDLSSIESEETREKEKFYMIKKLGFKLSEYHIKIQQSLTDTVQKKLIEDLQAITPKDDVDVTEEFVEDLTSKFKDVLSTVDLDILIMSLETIKPNIHVRAMRINTLPAIVQIGQGPTKIKAEYDALTKLIDSMILILQ